MIDSQYEDLLAEVLESGFDRPDRTGVGTRGIFHAKLRYDMADGFPVITTKRVHLRSVVGELIWFLRGDTNVRWLQQRGVSIWDEWAREDGSLGPVYGKQLRHIASYTPIKPMVFEAPERTWEGAGPGSKLRSENPFRRTVFDVGYYGDCDFDDPHYEMLVTAWREMLRRCYHETSKQFDSYGAAGIHVTTRWHCFANFQRDAKKLPGWVLKVEYPSDYSLDKDTLWASNRYGPETCMWASNAVQQANRSNTRYFTASDPEGNPHFGSTIGDLARSEGLNVSAVHRCLSGKLKTHKGWSDFQYVEVPEGHVLRYQEVDQVKEVIASLKHDPYSRRHVMSLWTPTELGRMALPPCHGVAIQFYVGNGRLSCSMYQRSADLFLGVPFGITSYALLLHMMAREVGLEPGELIWSAGDVHIYNNHIDQVYEQIRRDPYPFPTLDLAERDSIFDYEIDDVKLINYVHHSAIKAPVAV